METLMKTSNLIFKHIIASIRMPAYWISFNRPEKKNAINSEMYDELIFALRDADRNSKTSLTVITGEGDFYSSGNDFSSGQIPVFNEKDRSFAFGRFIDELIDHKKPLIGLVNGPAIGIACTTLPLFDLVIASESAFFRTPFVQLGASPEGCSTATFPALMGHSRASKLLMFGEDFTSKEAFEAGLLSKLWPKSEFVQKTEAYIEKIGQFSIESLSESKRLLRSPENREFLHEINKREQLVLLQRLQAPETLEILKKMFT